MTDARSGRGAIDVPPLAGEVVRLEPLTSAHVAGLAAAASGDRSSFGFTVVPDGVAATHRYVADLLRHAARAETVPFVQLDAASGRVLGATRYLHLRRRDPGSAPYAVEIGGTWLSASAQRSAVNTEAKWLLLRHAFEAWGVARVDLKTDARNERARAAIARLGATCEGVLRHWQPSQVPGEEDRYRDSAMYAVTKEEWPAISQRLVTMIASRR